MQAMPYILEGVDVRSEEVSDVREDGTLSNSSSKGSLGSLSGESLGSITGRNILGDTDGGGSSALDVIKREEESLVLRFSVVICNGNGTISFGYPIKTNS